jgi:MFS family permease
VGVRLLSPHDPVIGYRTLLRSGSSGRCGRRSDRPFHHESIQQEVTPSPRRIYLIILNLFCIGFTAALQAGDVVTLYVFRILQGVVAGVYMNFIPAYISEITPKELGSRFGVYPQISVVLGVLVSFVVAMIMTDVFDLETDSAAVVPWQANTFWRVMCIIPILAPVLQLFFIAIGYIPESPYSLIVRNRR